MNKMTLPRCKVKKQTPASWPAWTDEVVFYPTDADQAANAAQNDSWDDQGPAPDDASWDERAQLAAEEDRLERGVRFF